MDARLQRRVQRYGWDKAAAFYERYWAAALAPVQRQVLALAAAKPGERVLDVACGTGLVTFPLADAVGTDGAVTATDLSEAMVAGLAAEISARGLSNVTVARMDAEALQLPDASFDLALCVLGLMYVPDPVTALKEMARVLKPGGRAAVAVWGRRDHCGWAELFPIVDARVASEVCPMFFQLGSPQALVLAMEQAGLAGVADTRIAGVLRYANGDDACGAAFDGGPVSLAYSRFDAATRAEVHAEYLASIAAWRREGGYEIPGEFVLGSGFRAPA